MITILSRVQVQERDVDAIEEQRRRAEEAPRNYTHAAASAMAGDEDESAAAGEAEGAAPVAAEPYVRGDKVGRNDPCPCGSGKKYKHCHGQLS